MREILPNHRPEQSRPGAGALSRVVLLVAAFGLIGSCRPVDRPFLTADKQAALDEILRTAVESREVPGAVLAVTDRERVIYLGAYGVMDDAGDEMMRTDAIFQIYSMTKPITSLAIMMLVERGALSLDDDAATCLPELRDREVLVAVNRADSTLITRPASGPITLRDLLRHTSGFGYTFSSTETLEMTRITGTGVRAGPLVHDPGVRWTYGMGTAFLGWIIEEVSGRALGDFLDAEIFEPLGMTDTSFDLAEEDANRLVAGHIREADSLRAVPRPDVYRPLVRGDGGLLSTADDYCRFMRLVIGGGEAEGVRLVSNETLREMTRNQLDGISVVEQPAAIPTISKAFPLGAGRDGFGLGFQVSVGREVGRRPPGSLSWAGFHNTHFWIDRENEIGVVLLMQLLPFYDEQAIDLLTAIERTLYGG